MPELLDPNSIVISEDRQRAEVGDVEDIQASIARNGLINPIVVRQVGDEIIIVAGARRTQACRNLGKFLEIGRDVRFWDDLSPVEAEIIELEENLKRTDLPWRDQVRAVARLHQRYSEQNPDWTNIKTGVALSLSGDYVGRILTIHRALEAGHLTNATDISNAHNLAMRIAERKAEAIVNAIVAGGKVAWFNTSNTTYPAQTAKGAKAEAGEANLATQLTPGVVNTTTPPPSLAPFSPVLCANFLDWGASYSGPKFNLLHIDFPYGIIMSSSQREAGNWTAWQQFDEPVYDNDPGIYFKLLEGLGQNLDRILSHNAHVLFWFTMKWYAETKKTLELMGLTVQPYPFIWDKSPTGMSGDARLFPKITYDTAFICSRGQRPLAKYGFLTYKAPTPSPKMHPSQKSESMMKAFLTMFVDETTTLLDPTCGYGGALRAADELGAASILGIELDPNHAQAANEAIIRARRVREASL